MAQSGIHALSSIFISKFFKHKRWFVSSFIFGAMLPDIDILISAITFLLGTNIYDSIAVHQTFTHSIFTTIIIYLIFLSIAEITSKHKFKKIGQGLCLGITSHIILDVFLWFEPISLLWPVQPYLIQPTDIWKNTILDNEQFIKKLLLAFEFIFFRVYGWILINKTIQAGNIQSFSWFIKYISKWIKIEFTLFLIFILLIYFNIDINTYIIFFATMYIPSLIMALISTYILRDVFND